MCMHLGNQNLERFYVVFTERTRDVEPMLGSCWPIVYDAGPTSTQHCFNVLCSLGITNISIQNARKNNIPTQIYNFQETSICRHLN